LIKVAAVRIVVQFMIAADASYLHAGAGRLAPEPTRINLRLAEGVAAGSPALTPARPSRLQAREQ